MFNDSGLPQARAFDVSFFYSYYDSEKRQMIYEGHAMNRIVLTDVNGRQWAFAIDALNAPTTLFPYPGVTATFYAQLASRQHPLVLPQLH